jgi:myo-inositol-1(or 4)-monophosphatase
MVNDFLSVAIKAAKKAGVVHRKYFKKGMKVSNKGSHDILTKADIESENMIISEIRKSFPNHNILTEESKQKLTDSKYRWIIDPVDGTANFFRRIPFFSLSIALQKDDKNLVGVVYNPILNELFYAERGKGAYLNNRKISVNSGKSRKYLVDVLVYPECTTDVKKRSTNIMKVLLDKYYEVRLLYSIALPLAYVADGRLDASICLLSDVFGTAAGKLLIEEAGGIVTNTKGERLDDKPCSKMIPTVAIGNSKIEKDIMEVINKPKR